MRKLILTLAALVLGSYAISAQDIQDTETNVEVVSVFEQLPGNVTVRQSAKTRAAMDSHVEMNARREAAGYLTEQTYRIRIYFDNGRNARAESEAAAARFKSLHPGVSVSRTFTSPFFKVTVGHYSSKADAAKALPGIQREFPSAFIVRDNR